MKNGLSFLAATSAVSMLLLSSIEPALAAKSPRLDVPKSFQAQFILQVGNDPIEHGTMYYSHGRIREEMTPTGGGAKIVTIIDPARKMVYLIEADKKAFKRLQWDEKSALISEALRRPEKRKLVATETIDGQECDDFEIIAKEAGAKPLSLWVNKGTRFPVELTAEDSDPAKKIQLKWTNLNPGYQAAGLFDPPLGYKETK